MKNMSNPNNNPTNLPSAMILAAGRGERMRPLTDQCPKPLLPVKGKPIIEWHIEALKQQGFKRVVINHAWLGQQIESYFGDGSLFGIEIEYSREEEALETAGGITAALPLLGVSDESPYIFIINGDILADWDFSKIFEIVDQMKKNNLMAYLILVENPEHNPLGDFILLDGKILNKGADSSPYSYTLSGIGVYHYKLFKDISPGQKAKLAPLLRQAIAQSTVGGCLHRGFWYDIGTINRYLIIK
jgi:MurNAc alpha-1-phosphate uridylyltransferase